MARIERTDLYPVDESVTADDYVIGTDADAANRTKNYQISDILALGGVAATGETGTFRHVGTFGSYSGNVLIYADGALVATLADGQEAIVDLSKTLIFTADGGTQPTFEIAYQDDLAITMFSSQSGFLHRAMKFSKAHYENLKDAVLNGYATITTFDVM